jgi:hypothetical protein
LVEQGPGHALGYPKSVTKNFCAHFWVKKSFSMMCMSIDQTFERSFKKYQDHRLKLDKRSDQDHPFKKNDLLRSDHISFFALKVTFLRVIF